MSASDDTVAVRNDLRKRVKRLEKEDAAIGDTLRRLNDIVDMIRHLKRERDLLLQESDKMIARSNKKRERLYTQLPDAVFYKAVSAALVLSTGVAVDRAFLEYAINSSARHQLDCGMTDETWKHLFNGTLSVFDDEFVFSEGTLIVHYVSDGRFDAPAHWAAGDACVWEDVADVACWIDDADNPHEFRIGGDISYTVAGVEVLFANDETPIDLLLDKQNGTNRKVGYYKDFARAHAGIAFEKRYCLVRRRNRPAFVWRRETPLPWRTRSTS